MLTMTLLAVLFFIVIPTIVMVLCPTEQPEREPVCSTCGDTAEWCPEMRAAMRRHPSNG